MRISCVSSVLRKGSSNMGPHIAGFDTAYMGLVDAVGLGDAFLTPLVGSDASYLSSSQFSASRAFAPVISTFTNTISYIDLLIAEEKMLDCDTAPSITSMEHMFASRDRSFVDNPRGAMCAYDLIAKTDITVAAMVSADKINTGAWSWTGFCEQASLKRNEVGHDDISVSLLIRVRTGVASAASPEQYSLREHVS